MTSAIVVRFRDVRKCEEFNHCTSVRCRTIIPEMQVTLKCTSPHWRADFKTLVKSCNEVTLTGFDYWVDGLWCENTARNHRLCFNYDPATRTALLTR